METVLCLDVILVILSSLSLDDFEESYKTIINFTLTKSKRKYLTSWSRERQMNNLRRYMNLPQRMVILKWSNVLFNTRNYVQMMLSTMQQRMVTFWNAFLQKRFPSGITFQVVKFLVKEGKPCLKWTSYVVIVLILRQLNILLRDVSLNEKKPFLSLLYDLV